MNLKAYADQLEDLLKRGHEYALNELRRWHRISPAFLYCSDGKVSMAVSPEFESERAKQHFFNSARLISIAERATAGLIVCSCWLKTPGPGESLNSNEAIEQALDRREYVLLAGEARSVSKQILFPVIRYDNGHFHGLGEAEVPTHLAGKFNGLVPQQEPDPAAQEIARALLRR
jgi:hypothetical protein